MVGKILIAGYGSAGQYVLDLITRIDSLKHTEILVISRSEYDIMIKRINTTVVSAGIMGYYPKISYKQADLTDIDATAEIISNFKPDVIAYTGRFVKGIKYGAYSYPNELGYGVWLPLALPLIYKLMQAVKKSGVDCKVINSSYPDGVCPALETVGLAPYTGAGNLNHLIPRISLALAAKHGVSPYDVNLKMVGSHYLNTYVSKEGIAKGSEYIIDYSINGKPDIEKADADELFKMALMPMNSDHIRNLMISSDIARIIESVFSEDEIEMHLPGPNGLIGGYPCMLSKNGIRITMPEGVTLERAVEVNSQSLSCDGVKAIQNGVISFMEDAVSKVRRIFGIDYPASIAVDECEELAFRLKDSLLKYEAGK